MRGLGFGAALGLVFATVTACNAGTPSEGSDGGNPANCPTGRPTTGASCEPAGLDCSYGCNVKASCDGRTWTVVELAIPCPIDGGNPDGPGACSTNADCQPSYSCTPGGMPSGCGICAMPQYPCSTDSDCKVIGDAAPPKPMVCGPGGPCVCGVGGKSGSCIGACQGPNDCGADETCAPTGHCVPKPCTSDTECPSSPSVDYACSASGVCAPRSCTTNADCGTHYCVSGTCYPQQGQCAPPAA